MTKLEALLKHFFPSNRTTIFPSEDCLEPLTYILHFILSRHPEYGRELCLELIQESTVVNMQKSGNIASILAPERTLIVINAILLSLHNTEREVAIPTWPSSVDFTRLPTKDDLSFVVYLHRTRHHEAWYAGIPLACFTRPRAYSRPLRQLVGSMSVFDEQWSHARVNAVYEESHNFVVRRHSDGTVTAYPAHLVPQISLLQTSFQAWPRLLHPSLLSSDAIDMLLRGVAHVEPGISDAASAALKRFMDDGTNTMQVISQFNQFLFSPVRIAQEAGLRLYIEYPPLLNLWVDVVEIWIQSTIKGGLDSRPDIDQVVAKCSDIEAASLFPSFLTELRTYSRRASG